MNTKRCSTALCLLAIAAAGCPERIVGSAGGAGGAGACPADAPAPGDPCEGEDACTFSMGSGCAETATCLGERWRVSFGEGCTPPEPTCPAAAPGEATPCFQIGAVCSYDSGTACDLEFDVTCVDPGTWHRGEIPPCDL